MAYNDFFRFWFLVKATMKTVTIRRRDALRFSALRPWDLDFNYG